MTDSVEPLITVIVVNRNRSDLLEKCLGHIFKTDLSGFMEVIVVDNGSTDDSVSMAQRVFPRALIIQGGRNLGFSKANNLAAKKANGRFLLLVNSDAMLERDCPSKLVQLMEKDPQIGMTGPQLLNEDGSPQTSFEAVPTLATEILNRSLLKRLFPSKYPGKGIKLHEPTPVPALIGAVMMIRKEALEKLGGFDEQYFFFLEETDLAVRMRERGYKVFHHPAARALHLHGATASGYRSAARIEFYRSRYIFFKKHYPPFGHRILRIAMILNLLLNVIFLSTVNLFSLGRIRKLRDRLAVRFDLLRWHLLGEPEEWGLPRD